MLFHMILATESKQINDYRKLKIDDRKLTYFLNEVSGLDESNLVPGMKDRAGN